MYVSHLNISSSIDNESVDSSASYVILLDFETKPVEAKVVVIASPTCVLDFAPVSNNKLEPFEDPPSLIDAPTSNMNIKPLEVLASSNYFLLSDTESEPSDHDPKESSEKEPLEDDLSDEDPMEDRSSYSLPSSSPSPRPSRKRCRSPTPSPSLALAATLSPLVSISPSPAAVPSPPLDMISSCKRYHIWRDREGVPSTFETTKSSFVVVAPVLLVTRETIHQNVPLLEVRLARHDTEVKTLRAKVVSFEQETMALRTKAEAIEQHDEILCDSLRITRDRISVIMSTTKQGIGFAKIEELITQRVVDVMTSYEAN
nr:hypothetical protein [Tanacetum cinerariifolium]